MCSFSLFFVRLLRPTFSSCGQFQAASSRLPFAPYPFSYGDDEGEFPREYADRLNVEVGVW